MPAPDRKLNLAEVAGLRSAANAVRVAASQMESARTHLRELIVSVGIEPDADFDILDDGTIEIKGRPPE